MKPDRTHARNAMLIMKSQTKSARVEWHQACALYGLAYAVLDLAQAVRELGLKSEVPGND